MRAHWSGIGLAVALCAALASTATAAPHPERMTLRLSDLDPGYQLSNDSGCGFALAGEGYPRSLTRLYLRYPHTGCETDLRDSWTPGVTPRPPRISSTAFVFLDPAGPAAELERPRRVVSAVTGLPEEWLAPAEMPTPLGDESFAFRTNAAAKDVGEPMVFAWRSGRVLAVLRVDTIAGEPFQQTTFELAAVQQRHIVAPTPLGRSDRNDVEVPLDDPQLGIAAMWLGRRFQPSGDLPRLTLASAGGAPDPLGTIALFYGSRPLDWDLQLYHWHRTAWSRHARTRFGRLIWHERCVRSTRIPVEGGTAVIHAGYVHPPARCRHAHPDRFLAHVYLDDVVVSVNPAIGWTNREWGGPYDSLAGMRAVVRALRPRPQRL